MANVSAGDRRERRTALVSGGSRGIGRACALALAGAGHCVAVASRTAAVNDEVVEEISRAGGQAVAVEMDVTDPASVKAACQSVEAEVGPVAILVNGAGVTGDGLLAKMSTERWRSVLATNLDGAYHLSRQVVPGMMRARWGRIVTISSVVGLSGSAGQANYAAAKAGQIGFARAIARELAPRHITSNIVAPGPIDTDMLGALSDERRQQMAASVPLGRLGASEEVAAAVAFLTSEEAAFITGAVLPVDGGLGMGH